MQDARKHLPVTAQMLCTLSSALETTPLAGTFGFQDDGGYVRSVATSEPQTKASPLSEGPFVSQAGSGSVDMSAFDSDMGGICGGWFHEMDVNTMSSWYFAPTC